MAKPFEEAVFDKLYQIFYSCGVAPNVKQQEALRKSGKDFAELIQREATLKAIEMLEKVQERVLEAIQGIEVTIGELDKRLKDVETGK